LDEKGVSLEHSTWKSETICTRDWHFKIVSSKSTSIASTSHTVFFKLLI